MYRLVHANNVSPKYEYKVLHRRYILLKRQLKHEMTDASLVHLLHITEFNLLQAQLRELKYASKGMGLWR